LTIPKVSDSIQSLLRHLDLHKRNLKWFGNLRENLYLKFVELVDLDGLVLKFSSCPDKVASLDHPNKLDRLLAYLPNNSVILNLIHQLEQSLVTHMRGEIVIMH